MSLETLTFTEELKKLDRSHEELRESERKLRGFILSPEFLIDYIKFEQLLGDFQDKLVTLAEVVQTPVAGLPQTLTENVAPGQLPTEEAPEKEKPFSLEKALVVVAAIVACGITVQKGILHPMFLVVTVLVSIMLMFLPQVRTVIASLLHREEPEEEEAPALKLEGWISDSIAKIRSLYTAARFLIKVQNQTKESLPHYGILGMDDALYDRRKFFNETLPSEFLSRIGKIIVACDKNLWARKSLLISAIVQAKQVSMPGRS